MKTILICGINGYLGSSLAKRLHHDYNIIGVQRNINNLSRLSGYEFPVYESVDGIQDELFKNHSVDIIIQTATSYGRSNESDSDIIISNLQMPQELIEKGIDSGCRYVINNDTALDPQTSSYALSKKQFKDWLIFYASQKKVNVINLVLEHFYGPYANKNNFIINIFNKMLGNNNEINLTKCEQNRDFLHINDLLDCYDLLLEEYESFSCYEEFDVGTGNNINLKYLLNYMKSELGSKSNLRFGALPYRKNEIMNSDQNIKKLNRLGWHPKISIENGIKELIKLNK